MESLSIVALMGQMSALRLEALFAQDPKRAAEWVYVAAAEGLPKAQVCYGRMLLEGSGVAKDPSQALKWFRRAAQSGDLEAINMMGRCLENGWGAMEDPAAAAEQFKLAADGGLPWAQYNLGHMYLNGRGVARDWTRAYAYYFLAAAQQHPRAMNLVGRCCEEGWGTPRDLEAAAYWYQRSAEGGYFRGQYNWASVLLKSGRFDEAATWFERAALMGTAAVRQAIAALILRVDSSGANALSPLQQLAARLRSGNFAVASA